MLAVSVWAGPLLASSLSFEPELAKSSLMGSENEAEVQVLLSMLNFAVGERGLRIQEVRKEW